MKKLGLIILLLVGFHQIQANCVTNLVAAPVVDSISVDLAGNVTICWQPVVDPDIVYYTIFMVNPLTGANDSIDSIPATSNCYTIPAGSNNSDNESVEFGVVAIDACNNPSPVGVNYHNTMYLENTVNICAATISLSWNPYDDFNSGTNVLYNIYVSENVGPYVLAGTSLTTNFTFSGINQGSTYNFYVMAIENGGAGPFSSSSNDINVNTITFLKDPTFNYLYTATVVASDEIDLQFYVDTAADISSYLIKRAIDPMGTFETIGSVAAFAGMNPMVQFTDNANVDANNTYYFYKVETINTCGDLKFTSNIARTIWLQVLSDPSQGTNTLTFTQYDGWLGNVQKYDIYRAVGGIWDPVSVGTVAMFSDSTVYVDDVFNITQGNGEFCYKITATENPAAHVGGLPEATSTSNEACAFHDPLLYVPNAFAPTSHINYEFKPILTFPDPTSYVLQIYNKWGQKIFETGDVNEGWNGRMENTGKMCQVDTYVYLIKFKSGEGDEFQKRGMVTLVN